MHGEQAEPWTGDRVNLDDAHYVRNVPDRGSSAFSYVLVLLPSATVARLMMTPLTVCLSHYNFCIRRLGKRRSSPSILPQCSTARPKTTCPDSGSGSEQPQQPHFLRPPVPDGLSLWSCSFCVYRAVTLCCLIQGEWLPTIQILFRATSLPRTTAIQAGHCFAVLLRAHGVHPV